MISVAFVLIESDEKAYPFEWEKIVQFPRGTVHTTELGWKKHGTIIENREKSIFYSINCENSK